MVLYRPVPEYFGIGKYFGLNTGIIGVTPRYDQVTLNLADRHNQFQQIVSPNPGSPGVWIQQDAWFHLGQFDNDFLLDYTIIKSGNGLYAFILKGDVTIDGNVLNERDGLWIRNTDKISVQANSAGAKVLLMEVPMNWINNQVIKKCFVN